jgi:hypothetical protein
MLLFADYAQGWMVMDERIRDYGPLDEEAVVELSLRAWAPVFSSLASAFHEAGAWGGPMTQGAL